MKPICAMVEYASMRLRLVCAMAQVADRQRRHRQHDQHLLPIDRQPEHAFDQQADGDGEGRQLRRATDQKVTAVGAPW